MTEAEALKRWCPMVQLTMDKDSYANSRCVGSDCMAWRWDSEPTDLQAALMRSEQPQAQQAASMMTLGGYCGLAGKP